jgi:hypothetical protein
MSRIMKHDQAVTEEGGRYTFNPHNFFPSKLVQVAQVGASWRNQLRVLADRLRFELRKCGPRRGLVRLTALYRG